MSHRLQGGIILRFTFVYRIILLSNVIEIELVTVHGSNWVCDGVSRRPCKGLQYRCVLILTDLSVECLGLRGTIYELLLIMSFIPLMKQAFILRLISDPYETLCGQA